MKRALAIVLLGLAGSGGSYDCNESSSCPADPPQSSTAITACKSAIADSKCGSAYKSVASCFHDNATCAQDGTTDATATSSTCQKELSAYTACTQG